MGVILGRRKDQRRCALMLSPRDTTGPPEAHSGRCQQNELSIIEDTQGTSSHLTNLETKNTISRLMCSPCPRTGVHHVPGLYTKLCDVSQRAAASLQPGVLDSSGVHPLEKHLAYEVEVEQEADQEENWGRIGDGSFFD